MVNLVGASVNLSSGDFFNPPGSISVGQLNADAATSIQGPGFISGSVINGGQVSFFDSFGGGTLSIGGDFQETSSASLSVQVGGSQFSGLFSDQVSASTAELDGTLNVGLSPGYTPSVGDTFTIVSAGSVSGNFATVNFPTLTGGLIFTITYNSGSVSLSVAQGSTMMAIPGGLPGQAGPSLSANQTINAVSASTLTALSESNYLPSRVVGGQQEPKSSGATITSGTADLSAQAVDFAIGQNPWADVLPLGVFSRIRRSRAMARTSEMIRQDNNGDLPGSSSS
jgi:hypothetical protein